MKKEEKDKSYLVGYDSPHQENQVFQEGKIRTRVPVELKRENVISLLQQYEIEHLEDELFVDKCVRFMQLVYRKQITQYIVNKNGYVQLMASIYSKDLGKNKIRKPHYYRYIRIVLQKIGLLKVSTNYHANNGKGESMGYKVLLQEPYLIVDEFVDEKVMKDWIIEDCAYHEKLLELVIDEQKFTLIANLLPKPKKDQGMWILDYWVNNIQYVTVDKNKRVHSLLSQLPKEFRCCFTIDNEAVFDSDIHACQPYLILSEVTEMINNNRKKKKTLPEIMKEYPDVLDYVEDLMSGNFYEHFYRILKNLKKKPIEKYELDDYKIKMLAQIFFADTIHCEKFKKSVRVFSELYPTIFKCIQRIKTKYGYEAVANILQTRESIVMTKAIAKLQEKSDSWVLRFHDAILSKASNMDEINKTLTEVCLSEVGIEPIIKSGLWGKEIQAVLNDQNLGYGKTFVLNDYHCRRLKSIHKEKNKIFGKFNESKTIEEKKEKYKNYKISLDSFENEELVKKKESEEMSDDVIYPVFWTDEQKDTFNIYALNTITAHIYKQYDRNNQFEKSLIDSSKIYWASVYKCTS
jgi:hypothetical protein